VSFSVVFLIRYFSQSKEFVMDKVVLNWQGGMQYDAHIGEHTIVVDASEEMGGMNLGARPKPLLLVALAGCTGMDIASLARKMRVDFTRIDIEAEADKTEEVPSLYTAMRLRYRFEGEGIEPAKPLKMVALSQQRYCGVSDMLRRVAPISIEVYLNGERIDERDVMSMEL